MSGLLIAIQPLIAGNCADCRQQPARVRVHGHRYAPTPIQPTVAAPTAASSFSTLGVFLRWPVQNRPLLNRKQVSAVLHRQAPAPFCAEGFTLTCVHTLVRGSVLTRPAPRAEKSVLIPPTIQGRMEEDIRTPLVLPCPQAPGAGGRTRIQRPRARAWCVLWAEDRAQV